MKRPALGRLLPPHPGRRSVPRALAGAAVAVGGVTLGIVSLLWVTDDPSQRLGPAVRTQVTPSTEPPPLADRAPPERAGGILPSGPAASSGAVAPTPVTPPLSPAPAPDPVTPSSPTPTPATPSSAPSSPAPERPPPPSSAATSLVVPVTVLNNSRRTGLAERAGARFERGGWPVASTGNFRGRIPVTTVYYDPGMEASARAFAATFDGIARVRPRFATLPARGVVVVLTREFAA